jgi:hypothetical protein
MDDFTHDLPAIPPIRPIRRPGFDRQKKNFHALVAVTPSPATN